jgi:repressor LexA
MVYLTKRQKQIYDFILGQIKINGYAPSIKELCDHFETSSLATMHKHLVNLAAKGLIKRQYNRSRSIEIIDRGADDLNVIETPMLGSIAAGSPIEAIEDARSIGIPLELLRGRHTYVLRVKGDSMIDEHIMDGDYAVVESRTYADNGEIAVVLLERENVTLKKVYREKGYIRLQPANPNMEPIILKDEDVRIQGVVVGIIRKYLK